MLVYDEVTLNHDICMYILKSRNYTDLMVVAIKSFVKFSYPLNILSALKASAGVKKTT